MSNYKDIEIIKKTLDTQGMLIKSQQEIVRDLDETIDMLKGVPDGDRERARQYLLLSIEQSPIFQRAVDDVLENDLTPSDITLKKLTLGIVKKPRYSIYKDKMGICREEY